jgi:hypothetical protein
VLASLLEILLVPRLAAAQEPNQFRITGRVVDRSGKPLNDTWITTKGSRRSGTLTAVGGRYVLDIQGSTAGDLVRYPLLLRVQARHKGWKLTVPGGDTELAFELSVVPDSAGGSLLRVRSNDASIATMLADEAVLQSGTRVALNLDFVGDRGESPEAQVVEMTAISEVPITAKGEGGKSVAKIPPADRKEPEAPTSAGTPAGSNATPWGAPITTETRDASGKTAALDPVSEILQNSSRDKKADKAAARKSKRHAKADAPPDSQAAVPEDFVPNLPLTVFTPDPGAASATAAAPDSTTRSIPPPPAVATEPATTAPASPDTSVPSSPAVATPTLANNEIANPTGEPAKKKKHFARVVVRPGMAPDPAVPSTDEAQRDLEKPPVIRPGDPEAQAADVEKRMKRKPRARYATGEEIRRALELMGEPVPAAGGAAGAAVPPVSAPPDVPSAASATATATSAPPAGTPSPTPASPSSVNSAPDSMTSAPASQAPANPAPASTEPARTDPETASSASVSPAPPETTPPPVAATTIAPEIPNVADTSDSCRCRIEGTVEVVSDQPLPERVPVIVYLDDNRKITDTVELFMGSPRQFNLRNVPCSAHTIKVKALSKLKFTLTTAHPVVDCTGGGYRQVRITMEPFPKKHPLPLSAR